jgi:nucleotide-binding universal stress UspA family protein
MKMFERILVATDFSPDSMPAFEEAIRLAKNDGAVLLITHVSQDLTPAALGYAPPAVYDEWEEKLRQGVEAKLQPMVERARKEGIEVRARVPTGFADEAIVEAARKDGADLIIMGTHGRRGASRFFLGSVAARVISMAPCPVLTVRRA